MDAQHPSTSSRDRLLLAFTPAQVIALGLVAASIGWAVWLLRDRPTTEEVELLAGMALPSSEMAIMEAAFDRAQLTDHRTDGGRVWVPRSRQSAYMRALVDAEALPREFGGSLRRALEKNSPWQSRAVQGELLRVATQEELSLVICSMPGIERAAVLYDTESHHGLEASGPAKTASVNVRTQTDMELDPSRVQAIRVLVSASIAGLAPERVAVTDLRSGRVYVGPLEADSGREATALVAVDPTLARKIAHEQHLATKVRQSLAFLKGATVDVSVEFPAPGADPLPVPPRPEDIDASRTADQTATQADRLAGPVQKIADANAPAEIRSRLPLITTPAAPAQPSAPPAAVSDLPESILVSIAVPESYFLTACRATAEKTGQPVLQPLAVEAQETERIRRHVQSLLPATRDPAQRRVSITSFPVTSTPLPRRDQSSRGNAAAELATASVMAATSTASTTDSHPPHRTPAQPPAIGAILTAIAAGRFDDVPQQGWLAATSICVGLLAGFLWWAGSRGGPSTAGRGPRQGQSQPRIDWSAAGEPSAPETLHATPGAAQARSGFGIGRAAVLLVSMAACATPALATGPEQAAALAPLPEPLPADVEPAPPAGGSGVPQVLPALPLPARMNTTPIDLQTGPTASTGRSGQLTDWKLLAAIAATFAVVAAGTALTKRRATLLPPDVFEVLGAGSLGGQHAVRIVRFGPKTLLVGVSAAGCQTLAELSDPQATACIAAACRGLHPPLRPTAPVRSSTSAGPSSAPVRAVGEAT
jgi:type III secretory pathway lipoprotein EscJ